MYCDSDPSAKIFATGNWRESISRYSKSQNTLQTSLVIKANFLFLLTIIIIIWLLSVLTAAYINSSKRQHIMGFIRSIRDEYCTGNQRFVAKKLNVTLKFNVSMLISD